MKTLNLFLKVQLTLLVLMLCGSTTAFGENNDVVEIDGIYYRLYQQEKWTDGHWDTQNNWVPGEQYTDYYATVTYNPEIDPWSMSTDGKYQGDLVIPETVNYNNQDYQVTSCEETAYYNAHNLTSISFPKTISYIEGSYLGNLNNLEAIIVDSENPNFTTIDGVLYNKEITNVLAFPCKRGGVYRVPATITEFGQNGNTIGKPTLDELIIPATVTKIGNRIFNNYPFPQIKKVTIEDSDNELTIGSCSNSWSIYDGGNEIHISPLFGQCQIQEVYWGRNVKGSNPPFALNDNLSKVTFGPKVTSVPKYSFYNCNVNTVDVLGGLEQWMGFDFTPNYTNPFYNIYSSTPTLLFNGSTLEEAVELPSGITKIPAHGFQYGCSGITNLTLNSDLEEIADGAFKQLDKLETIQLDDANTNFKVIDNVLYNKDISKILCFPRLRAGEYVMPSTITTMVPSQFYNCSELTDVTFSTNLEAIPENAFYGCTKLTSLTIPSNIKELGKYAFYGCSELTSVTLPSNLLIMPDYAFSNCAKLTSLTLPSSLTTIGYHAFDGCSLITSLTIPASTTAIYDNAFDGWTGLTNIVFEDGATTLVVGKGHEKNNEDYWSRRFYINGREYDARPLFVDSNIKDLYLGRNLEYQEEYSSPFALSKELTNIVLGPKVTSIPKYSFPNCYKVETVDVKGGLAQWCNFDFTEGSSPFYWSQILDENKKVLFDGVALSDDVTVPEGVTTIRTHVFQYNVAGITSLTLPSSLTEIANGAFKKLSNLETIGINNNNTYFKVIENVLYNDEVSKIVCFPRMRKGDYVMPTTVKELENSNFYYCTELTNVVFSSDLQIIPDSAFIGCSKLTSLTIPANITAIRDYAFDWCTGLKKLTIEDSSTLLKIGKGHQKNYYNEDRRYGLFASSPISEVYIGRNLEFVDFDGSGYYNETSWNGNEYTYRYYKQPFTSSLTSVTIGNQVNRMPAQLFKECWGITSVNFDGTIIEWCNITFEDADATPFGKSSASPILHLKGQPLHSQVNIPEGATKIGAYSFYGQNGVSNFTLPASLETIEPYAFSGGGDVYIHTKGIVGLENTNSFSGDIYVLDDYVKQYKAANVWSELASRIYPLGFLQVTVDLTAMSSSPALLPALNALEKVNDEYRITALTNLKIRGTMNGYDILMLRNKMPNLRHLDLSEATILTNDGGFEYYQGYHTETGAITPYMFYEISNLRSIILPEGITKIAEHAFAKSGLDTIQIYGTVKSIGSYAFSECPNLTRVTMNKGVETIGYSAFQNCNRLKSLVFPTTLKEIYSNAFYYCTNLTSIDFAEGLQYIGSGAFYDCSNLKELHLPTSLLRIEHDAFRYCSGLQEVHVPSMITEIGDYAFKDCGLKSVYAYTVTPVQINQNTFDYKGVDLYAPDNSFYAYYLNTQWSQFQDVKEFEALYTKWYTSRNTDVHIDTNVPIKNVDDNNPADGIMEPGSGLIFVGDGEQLVKNLILNWQHGSNYPALIEDNNLNVEELKFIMNVYPGRWYFFSFPFDIKISDTTFDGKYVWRYYDAEARAKNGSGGWKNVTDGWLRANVGYIFQANKEGELELPVNNPEFTQSNGQKEVPLESIEAKNPQDASWNFVGNPNLSYYSLEDMSEKVDAPITVWNEEQQTYTAVVPGDDEYNFHPFEAFFVQTPENVDNMTFEDENRATYLESQKKTESSARSAVRSGRSVNERRMLVNLTVSDGQTTDKTRVIFNDDNKLTYETGRDANKFMSMANVPQIYTIDAQNVKYSVNARPNGNRQVRLGFVASSDGNYTIAAERMDCSMALKDNQTGTIHQLDGKPYTFYSEAGTFDNRFTLMSGMNITSITANGLDGIDGFNVAAMDGGIVVTGANESDLNVYNANGVKAATLQGSGTINLNNGTYIVTYAGKSAKIAVK